MSVEDFGLSIRANIRGLWRGELATFDFLDSMRAAIERNLKRAWLEGAAICNIQEDELSDREIEAMTQLINSQFPHLIGFAETIEQNSRANGGQLQPLLQRGEMWINRYNEAKERGQGMACADEKAIWILGATEQHCKSCGGFAGRVYRFSVWDTNGAIPQTSRLCCGGFRCDCRREPTDQRVTPGPFPTRLLC